MDSISQAALGAAVGEAVLGRQAGYRAALWGAVAGTIPDLDVVAYPLMDEVTRLGWHRGYSHSIMFTLAGAVLLAWLISKIHKRYATRKEWTWLVFLAFFTHILLDSFTVYGTQLFLPFSRYMVGFNTIAIIDPLYTLPLLIGLILALAFKRSSRKRRIFNYLGLGLSTAYLLLTVGVKFHVNDMVEKSLESENIVYERYMTAPTIFNAVLWRATAEVEGGFEIGYYSVFDDQGKIDFRFVPQNRHLIKPIYDTRPVEQLLWFSNGYYIVSGAADNPVFTDLRFGEIQTDFSRPGQYIFSWEIVKSPPSGDGYGLRRADFSVEDGSAAFAALWGRLQGN